MVRNVCGALLERASGSDIVLAEGEPGVAKASRMIPREAMSGNASAMFWRWAHRTSMWRKGRHRAAGLLQLHRTNQKAEAKMHEKFKSHISHHLRP